MGPNVRKLVVEKMAKDAIPDGGGLADGIAFLSDKDRIIDGARDAQKWVEQALAVVKTAPNNPWGNNDEAIAGEILKQIEAKRKSLGRLRPSEMVDREHAE